VDENLKWHNVPPLHLFDRSNLPRDKPHSRQGKEDCTLVNSIVAAGRHHHLMSMSTFAHYSNPLGKHLAMFLKCLVVLCSGYFTKTQFCVSEDLGLTRVMATEFLVYCVDPRTDSSSACLCISVSPIFREWK
jgi:hypothetical protein